MHLTNEIDLINKCIGEWHDQKCIEIKVILSLAEQIGGDKVSTEMSKRKAEWEEIHAEIHRIADPLLEKLSLQRKANDAWEDSKSTTFPKDYGIGCK